MSLYIGTKMIRAFAMTRLAYNELRGWELPADENGADEGYLVEYLDGGKANHPNYAGYISWSPKAVFENAYIEVGAVDDLPAHIVRVKAERAQLHDKLEKLKSFFDTEFFQTLDANARSLLERQAVCMADYLSILDCRLAADNALRSPK